MKVKIKTWEELEKKYGLDRFGDIKNNRSNWIFSESMECLCGTEIELENVNSSCDSVLGEYDGYCIEKWMVEKNGKQRQSYKS